MRDTDPLLIELPMPIRSPRLLMRPWQRGDGSALLEAKLESAGIMRSIGPDACSAPVTGYAQARLARVLRPRCFARSRATPFEALGANRLAVSHAEGNDGSRQVIQKAGFEREGTTRRFYLLNGSLTDSHHYARFGCDGLPDHTTWG